MPNASKSSGGLKAVHEVEAGIEVGTQILKEYLNKTGSLKGALSTTSVLLSILTTAGTAARFSL